MAIELRDSVAPSKNHGPNPGTFFAAARISQEERMFFTERLALLLETGNSIHPSLEALREQTSDPRITAIISKLIDDVVGGCSFSMALAKHPTMFSATYVTLVRASEQGGFMAAVLSQLQAMEEKRNRLHSTLVAALSYPVFLSTCSSAVVLFILLVVFPKFGKLFLSIHDQLPFTTLLLMGLSAWTLKFWHLLLLGSLAGFFLLHRWRHSPSGQEAIDQLKLRCPGVGEIFLQVYLINFFRVMSLSLGNGVSVMAALESCREVVANVVFTRFVKRVEKYVAEGKGLSLAFMEESFIPTMVQQTIRTGDQTGNLALVMSKIADFYERELERKITTLSKLAEPILLLIMGVVVGVIVSALILPIFKIGRAVH